MKRFTISVICVMVFFIGVASIIEKTKASFAQDARAMEIINKARAAIGGEANIKKVKSMSIVAKTEHFFGEEQKSQKGALEINFALPNRYAKKTKIGDPMKMKGDGVTEKVEVIMMGGGSDLDNFTFESKGKNKESVFLFKKGEKGENVEDIEITDDKIIIKKKDGTTEELDKDSDKVRKIRIESSGEGNTWTTDDGKEIIVRKGSGGKNSWKTKDGKRIELSSDVIVGSGGKRHNEMLRMTIALLLTPPQGMNVQYKFLGEGNVDGNKTHIVGVNFKENSFKLHIDSSSNLPSMVSFEGNAHRVMVFREKGSEKVVEEKIIELKSKIKDGKKVAHEIKFSNFRTAGGLKLPHQWTETANGKMAQTVSVQSYKINPSDIEEKFKGKKIYVRKMRKKN